LHNTIQNLYLCQVIRKEQLVSVKINRKATMKAFKIFALILIMGVSQAGATGFAYNMSKAQQMLKAKREVVVTSKTSKTETIIKKEERKAASERASFIEKDVESDAVGEPVSDKMVSTFTQWLSQVLVKLLTAGFGL
jgi:hypothetical protein